MSFGAEMIKKTIERLQRRAGPALLPAAGLVFLCHLACSDFDSNPLDSDYEGNYAFSAEFLSAPDTLACLTPYSVGYQSTGSDGFAKFDLSGPEEVLERNFVDTSPNDSELVVYFKGPYTGEITVTGIRPNDKRVERALSVIVENKFAVEGDLTVPAGMPVRLTISHTSGLPLRAKWFVDDTIYLDTTASTVFEFFPSEEVDENVYALVSDTLGNMISTDTVAVSVFMVTGPAVLFEKDSLLLPLGSSITARVTKVNCDSVVWEISDLDFTTTTSSDTLKTNFPRIGGFVLTATGKTADGEVGDADTLYIMVYDDKPHVDAVTVSPFAILAGDPVTVRVSASVWNGRIDSVLIRDNDGLDTAVAVLPGASIETEINVTYATTGKYLISAAAVDSAGNVSDFVPATDSIAVNSGNPVVTGISPNTVYIMDDTLYTIHATDPGAGGSVVQWFVRWEDGGDFIEYADSALQHRFDQPGTYTVELYVADNDGNISETVSDLVTVLRGMPTVEIDAPVSAWVYDEIEVVLHGADTNGTVQQYAVSWDDGVFTTQADSLFMHTFSDSGEKGIRAYVVDEDGNSSDTVDATVTVSLGEPGFTSITTDSSMSRLFVLDPITWTITGTDPNGSVDSVLVSWDGDTVFEVRTPASQNSAAFVHTFARADSGQREIGFRVIDNDGFIVDSTITVMVLSGAPTIESFTPTETWINDDSTYTISANDENGELIAWFLDKNNDGIWNDTSETGDFVVSFPSAGVQTVRYGVMDEDSVVSLSSTEISVRLGQPGVWSPDGDTLFVVTPATGGEVELSIESYDTNGTIERYYWDFFGPPFDTSVAGQFKTTEPATSYTIAPSAVNDPFKIAVFVRDDDNLVSGDTLWLLPDAPPPAPTFFRDGQDGDSTVFKWERKLDVHDGLQTKVQIAYCFQTGCASTDSLYPSGSEPTIAEIEDQWGTEDIGGGNTANIIKADLPHSGLGRWRVILIDARGSRTAGPAMSGDPATFVAP